LSGTSLSDSVSKNTTEISKENPLDDVKPEEIKINYGPKDFFRNMKKTN
tara:strand:+ start:331 stop:477 length:147 start_codon:yes stop_codon:yes gene_type:complete